MSDVLRINLYKKHEDDRVLMLNIEQFKINKKLTEENSKYSVGTEIEFWGGFNNDIRYTSLIYAFDNEDGIYVIWDCYWFPIKDDEKTQIEIINFK